MVSNKGALVLVDNILGKFQRVNPKIVDMSGSLVSLRGAITQLAVFDMDQDGIDDVVVLDDSGDLSILYGSIGRINEVSTNEVIFQRKIVDQGLGVALSSAPRTDGGALYFDGLHPQIPEIEDFRDSSSSLAAQTTQLLADAT